MTYTCEIIIHQPIESVMRQYIDYDQMPRWQTSLVKVEHQNTPHQIGSISHLIYETNGQSMVMKETIEAIDIPHLYSAIYEVEGAWNRCVNRFEAIGSDTKWTMTSTFKFDQPNNISQSAFENKTYQAMVLFKEYLE